MPIAIARLRELEGQRVHMHFDDDHEVLATLISATEDFDGSLHLVYDRVEWANDPRELATAKDSAVYAEGESLISIAPEPSAQV